mmetsp:Transcript_40314/g.95795  ORF Transcript_40314/g.95795 Transcript_40314/m.95795 type:complete len:244 (-) Transcript_40314:17-748(-)
MVPPPGLVVCRVNEHSANLADGHGPLRLCQLAVLRLFLLCQTLCLLAKDLCSIHVALLSELLSLLKRLFHLRIQVIEGLLIRFAEGTRSALLLCSVLSPCDFPVHLTHKLLQLCHKLMLVGVPSLFLFLEFAPLLLHLLVAVYFPLADTQITPSIFEQRIRAQTTQVIFAYVFVIESPSLVSSYIEWHVTFLAHKLIEERSCHVHDASDQNDIEKGKTWQLPSTASENILLHLQLVTGKNLLW